MILPEGFLTSGIRCGIKKKGKDLGLILVSNYASACGVFTANVNCSYSVTVSRKHITNPVKCVVVNSGNANCFTHKTGVADTERICAHLAHLLGVQKENVLIASTGVIGEKLPVHRIISSFPYLIKNAGGDGNDFSESILTTDTFPKRVSVKVRVGGETIKVAGFAKGAGMIAPSMATMLAFVLTDAKIRRSLLQKLLKEAVDESFNSITVDGCMSTNDCVFALASGYSAVVEKRRDVETFGKVLKEVTLSLAKMIVKDAEGATKFITLRVKGAKTKEEAKKAAFSVANSSLFKAAMYGANPNWGRVVAALGAVGIKVKEEKLKITATSLKKKEIVITVNLQRGKYARTVYTSDLTPGYVRINAQYS